MKVYQLLGEFAGDPVDCGVFASLAAAMKQRPHRGVVTYMKQHHPDVVELTLEPGTEEYSKRRVLTNTHISTTPWWVGEQQ